MKLCVNYLEEVKQLLEEGKIDFIDYIKLYSINGDLSPMEWCSKHKDVMFHGIVGELESNIADKDFFDNRDMELERKYIELSRTPHISMHINARYGIIPTEDEAIKVIKSNVGELRKMFDKEILLENIPAIITRGKDNYFSKPDFISKVIDETECNFLFDIGHARVASEVLDIPFDEYVKKLPMNKIVETHMAGCMRTIEGNIIANHSKMNEEDYDFLKKLLDTSNTLRVVTLEYGTIKAKNTEREAPVVSYGKINEQAKEEVYEQLLRLKDILGK